MEERERGGEKEIGAMEKWRTETDFPLYLSESLYLFSFLPFLLLLLLLFALFEFSLVERDITRSLLEGENDFLVRRPNLI